MRRCIEEKKKRGGGAVHETHHISRALITSTLLPCVLDGFSGVRSRGSALSIPPTCSMFFFFLLCHSRTCVINLLSAHANRTLWSLFSLAGSSFQTVEPPFENFPCLVSTYRNPAAFSWDPEPEKRQIAEAREKRDRLTGECGSIIVAFHERMMSGGGGLLREGRTEV